MWEGREGGRHMHIKVFGILILCRFSKRFARGQRPQYLCGKCPVTAKLLNLQRIYYLVSPFPPFPLNPQQHLVP